MFRDYNFWFWCTHSIRFMVNILLQMQCRTQHFGFEWQIQRAWRILKERVMRICELDIVVIVMYSSKWKGWQDKCVTQTALFICAYNIDLACPYLPITLFSIWYIRISPYLLYFLFHFYFFVCFPIHEFVSNACCAYVKFGRVEM